MIIKPHSGPVNGAHLDRRGFLNYATAATVGAVAQRVLPAAGAESEPLARPSNASAKAIHALYETLSAAQKKAVCFDWDHRVNIVYGRKPLHFPDPKGVLLRTHVSNAWLITPHTIGSPFYTTEQRALILDVMETVLTPSWTKRIIQQAQDDSGLPWGGDQSLAIFGEPGSGRFQCVITGFHLTVRATSETQPLAAFGGPITHGHQPSGFYEKFGHPGNIFWEQALLANDVYRLFDGKQQEKALVSQNMPFYQNLGTIDRSNILPDTPWDEPRRESDIRFPRPRTKPLGLPVAEMASDQKRALETVLASLVQPYRQEYQDQVFACLKKHGGLEQCSLAFYQERDLGDDGQWDNWRLEGPALVWFFRGAPHVHIWIHVASDPAAPISSYFG